MVAVDVVRSRHHHLEVPIRDIAAVQITGL
jgi:hypothetical protein